MTLPAVPLVLYNWEKLHTSTAPISIWQSSGWRWENALWLASQSKQFALENIVGIHKLKYNIFATFLWNVFSQSGAEKMQETESTVYCPYPGRLGGQCICIFHNTGNTLSSAILWPEWSVPLFCLLNLEDTIVPSAMHCGWITLWVSYEIYYFFILHIS